MTTNADEIAQANRMVDAWLLDKSAALACSACSGPVTITDASARPHAEWYLIDCAGCGYHMRLHRATGRPRMGDD